MVDNSFPIRLRAARLMSGISMEKLAQLADNIITKQSISRYEKGLMSPKRVSKIALAKALNISESFFNGTNITIDMPSLRTSANNKLTDEDFSLIEAKLSFWAEQYFAKECEFNTLQTGHHIDPLPYQNPVKGIEISTLDDAIHAADLLRQRWNCGDGPIASILRLIERKGIRILSTELPQEVWGLSTWANNVYPLMVLDLRPEKTTTERIRFTAAHELAHLLFTFPKDSLLGLEKRCDMFAGSFLIPKSAFIEELGSEKREKITLEEMIDIKELYGQSLSASIIAARDYGIITTEYKRAWYAEHIEPNPREINNGHYAFPETVGKEKRINSIIKSMEE